MSFLIIFFTLLPLAALPAFIAFRLRDDRLLAVSVVCGLLCIFVVPWIIAVVLVCRKLPRSAKSPIPFGIFSAYWAIILFAFFVLPFMRYGGLSINGYQFFSLISLSSSASTEVVFLLLSLAVACLTSLCLRDRALLTGEMVMAFFSICTFAILAYNLFDYKIASFGTYLLWLMFLLGVAMLYFLAFHMSSAASLAGNGAISYQKMQDSLKKNAAAAGKVIRESLTQAQQWAAQSQESNPASQPGASQASVPQASVPQSSAPRTPAPQAPAFLTVRCLQGDYSGAVFTLKPGEKLLLGTDPGQVNLIFRASEISRLHLTMQNTGNPNYIRLIDSSRNGTYLFNGTRLPAGVTADYTLPCRIFFGKDPQVFEISRS